MSDNFGPILVEFNKLSKSMGGVETSVQEVRTMQAALQESDARQDVAIGERLTIEAFKKWKEDIYEKEVGPWRGRERKLLSWKTVLGAIVALLMSVSLILGTTALAIKNVGIVRDAIHDVIDNPRP